MGNRLNKEEIEQIKHARPDDAAIRALIEHVCVMEKELQVYKWFCELMRDSSPSRECPPNASASMGTPLETMHPEAGGVLK